MGRGDVATERGGLILPSPWGSFKAGIILDVKWVEMELMCHLLCTGTLGAASVGSCFPLDLMGREIGELERLGVRRADTGELVKLGKWGE